MAREFRRTDRLAQSILRELSQLLLREVDDPRLGGVLVSEVEVSRDFTHARVYLTVSLADDGDRGEGVLQAMTRAGGFLRTRLASCLRIKAVPELRFEIDHTLDAADHMESLLSSIRGSQ